MRIDPDTCTDVGLLAAEVRRLRAIIADRADKTDDPPDVVDSPSDPVAYAGKSVETGNIPPEWRKRPYWVDPPSGWAYGFTRLYDPATDGDMQEWMIANGYPETLARQGLPCTFRAANV